MQNFNFSLTFDDIYPIGSIYMSMSDVNPKELFGGVWQKLEDVFLLGASFKKPLNSRGGGRRSYPYS